jgi:hypothetical protein
VAADLVRQLEDREFGGPGGEAAFATEVAQLGEDRHGGVVGGLGDDVVELGAGERDAAGAPRGLRPGGAQQPRVESRDRVFPPWPAQLRQPSPRLGVEAGTEDRGELIGHGAIVRGARTGARPSSSSPRC